jgi:O-antigen ligase
MMYILPVLLALKASGLAGSADLPLLVTWAAIFGNLLARTFSGRSQGPPAGATGTLRFTNALVDLLLTIVFLSAAWLTAAADSVVEILRSSSFAGFGSRNYFLLATLNWSTGLLLFRLLINLPTGGREEHSEARPLPLLTSKRLGNFAAVATLTMALFWAIQWCFELPRPLRSHPDDPLQVTVRFSPLEDIHSFGSYAVVVFALLLGQSWRVTSNTSRLYLYRVMLVTAAGLLVASWTRTSWLAAGICVALWLLPRIPRAITVTGAAILIGLFAWLNQSPDKWLDSAYLYRLASLFRVERLEQKSPERIELLTRGFRMIADRPLMGHGIGSFYLTSPLYASTNPTLTLGPDFAHNAIVQFGAELGLPAAAVLAVLIALGFWHAQVRPGGSTNGPSVLGLALLSYLVTQMLTNSLNVYASNQLLFWLLMSAAFQRRLAPQLNERRQSQKTFPALSCESNHRDAA